MLFSEMMKGDGEPTHVGYTLPHKTQEVRLFVDCNWFLEAVP